MKKVVSIRVCGNELICLCLGKICLFELQVLLLRDTESIENSSSRHFLASKSTSPQVFEKTISHFRFRMKHVVVDGCNNLRDLRDVLSKGHFEDMEPGEMVIEPFA